MYYDRNVGQVGLPACLPAERTPPDVVADLRDGVALIACHFNAERDFET